MGDILDIIKTRKSIRRPNPVPDELLWKVLEAGRWAATGENDQPWQIVVVRNPETRKAIGNLGRIETGAFCTAKYGNGELQERFEGVKDPVDRERVMKMMYSGVTSQISSNAPIVLVVFGTCHKINTPYDLCAMLENMLLEAHSLGLGAVWVEGPAAPTRRIKIFKDLVGIPSEMGQYHIQAYMALGWPLENRRHPRPKRSLRDIVYWESFGQRDDGFFDKYDKKEGE